MGTFDPVDRAAYASFYEDGLSPLAAQARTPEAYRDAFRAHRISSYHQGGTTKGYVRGLATDLAIRAAEATGKPREEVHVLDAGCGAGELSVYFAAEGFRVTGVDISASGVRVSTELARRVGVASRCPFLEESLEQLSLPDASVDVVVGHGALHHFIKYPGVPGELWRVMRPGARGFFADSFGENRAYRLFHDKAQMERLGDVILNRRLIREYFTDFEVRITPTDWVSMLDKLYERATRGRLERLRRGVARVHRAIDRRVPADSSLALMLSGAVVTAIRKPLGAP